MSRRSFVFIFLLPTLACGGASTNAPTATAPTEFSWEAPVEEWWGAGDSACPDGAIIETSEEGPLALKQCMRNETPHGPRSAIHENGTLVNEGLFRDGKPEGRWREWTLEGNLAAVANFKGGELEGKTIQYLTGGARAEETYEQGKRQGVSKFFEKGDKLIREVAYKDGKVHGKQVEYYPSGKPRTETNHRDGLVHGTVTRYAPNGDVIGSFEIENGTGPWTDWHDNGKIATKAQIKNGVQDGDYVRYHPNGKQAIKGRFDNGKEIGKWEAWDEEGKLRALNSYEDGVPVTANTYEAGKLVRKDVFFANGGRKSRVDFDGKKREGNSVEWRDDGYRTSQGTYDNNKKQGSWYTFSKKNKPTLEVYENGRRVSKKSVDHADKPPEAEGIETGVERCDRFLRAYLSCPGIPPNVRQDFSKNFGVWNEQLKQATGEDADKLETACSEAEETWKKGLATAGC